MAGVRGGTRAGAFAHELGRSLAEAGLTLNRLARRLEVRGAGQRMETLIGWRSGRVVPQLDHAQVAALEEALEVPAGRFADLLPASESHPPGVARAREALGFRGDAGLAVRRIQLHLELDERGAERSITQRTTWVAERDGVRAVPVVALVQPPVGTPARVEALQGCRVGPTHDDLAGGVFATRLQLRRRLRAGQTAETVHRTLLPPDAQPDLTYEHRLLDHVEEVAVSIAFHPDLLPRAVRFFSRLDGVETVRELAVGPEPLQGRERDFGPGAVGFRWEW